MGGMKSAALLVSSATICLIATPAIAQAKSFNVPAQAAQSAISALGHQANVEIIGARRVTQGKRANSLHGNYTVEAALTQMLRGTGLTARRTGPQAYVVVNDAQPASPRAETRVSADAGDPPSEISQAASEPIADSSQIQDIIVTASRQAQNLQKVSAAVQVIGGDSLRNQAIVNAQQAFANMPSVQTTQQSAGASINIRGQGGDMPSGSTQGSVVLEFDGIYNVLSLGTIVGFFDVDRIEVLPGPQSTRYGPNADGGVVNVISTSPHLGSWDGRGSLTVGNYGLVRGEVAQNISISDTLAVRLAGAFVHRNSYFKPKNGNAIAQSGRIKLLWQPNDRLSANLTYQINHVGGTGNGVEPRSTSMVQPYASDSINDYGNPWHHGDYSTGCGTDGTRNTNDCSPGDNHADLTQQSVVGNLHYRFNDWIALDALGSYTNVKGTQTSCYANGAPWNVGGERNCYLAHSYDPFNQYTAEVRLHNADGSKLLWNIGYYHWQFHLASWAEGQRVAGPVGGGANGTTTNAIYADLTYPVTDRFRLIGGVRESFDDRSLYQGNGVGITYKEKLHHFDFRAGEEYDLSPTSMEYFTVTSGYRPGGLTYNGALGTAVGFASEVNTAFEVGLKNSFFDRRLQFNIDAFYYDQSNYQVNDAYAGYNVTLPDGSVHLCTNGPNQPSQCNTPTFNVDAHAVGVEAQLRFKPTRNDEFGLTATYMSARFNDKQTSCATTAAPATMACPYGYNDQLTDVLYFFNVGGAVQPHSPKLAFTVRYEHTFRFSSGSSLSIGGDAFHSSSFWVHPVQDTSLLGYQPGYWQENLSASFLPASEKWSLTAYVRNISNYAVKQSTLPFTMIGDPRTIGVTLGVKW